MGESREHIRYYMRVISTSWASEDMKRLFRLLTCEVIEHKTLIDAKASEMNISRVTWCIPAMWRFVAPSKKVAVMQDCGLHDSGFVFMMIAWTIRRYGTSEGRKSEWRIRVPSKRRQGKASIVPGLLG